MKDKYNWAIVGVSSIEGNHLELRRNDGRVRSAFEWDEKATVTESDLMQLFALRVGVET